ncbi:TetR/AcrR family transcriptional regulator [Sporosalibacterium faouarense]|uniref:TetR/AcrR family transcriptional regulator n=1 Tax=Sporosalibacterium faouarense TaxID=516123 RepID=UPI00192AF9E4|nr:TetR/AcrR family transcriptional regulator [Sporosalibacterium faouarense]
MQYLKEEVKKAIVKSAIKEFKEKSYTKASMRSIAKNAGVTVGNIYRYFDNKDDLFNFIVDPVWNDLERVMFEHYTMSADLFPITEIITSVMDIYKRSNNELFILFQNSAGSKYGNFKERLIGLIEKRIKGEYLPILKENNRNLDDKFIFYIISNAIVDSVYIIMKECDDDFKRAESLIKQTITIFFNDLAKRI